MKCGASVVALSKTADKLDTLKAEVGKWPLRAINYDRHLDLPNTHTVEET